MIPEIYESDFIEMGSDVDSNSRSINSSSEHIPAIHNPEHVWRDIVDYCRNYYEGQAADSDK